MTLLDVSMKISYIMSTLYVNACINMSELCVDVSTHKWDGTKHTQNSCEDKWLRNGENRFLTCFWTFFFISLHLLELKSSL